MRALLRMWSAVTNDPNPNQLSALAVLFVSGTSFAHEDDPKRAMPIPNTIGVHEVMTAQRNALGGIAEGVVFAVPFRNVF